MKLKRIVYQCFCVLLSCFFVIGLFFTTSGKTTFSILANLETYGYAMIYVWVYLVITVVMIAMRKRIYRLKRRELLLLLFIISFVPRALMLHQRVYVPMSDFKNYYNMGVYLVQGDKEFVRNIVSKYQIPKFGGLAVFMGIIAKLFSQKLIGFQIANILITSFISVLLYLCIESYSKKSAVISSLLFAIYPANIISSQVTTNHHAAILFTLIGIYLLIKIESVCKQKKIIFALASGAFFALSDFCHPSVIVPITAVMCYGIMGCFAKDKIDCSRIKYCLCTVLCYIIVVNISILCLKNIGIISNDIRKSSASYLPKIVVGLNENTGGIYSAESYEMAAKLNGKEQQEWCIQQIKERIFQKPISDTLLFFLNKADIVWFGQDSYCYWYCIGRQTNLKEAFDSGIISEEEYNDQINQLEIYYSYFLFDWLFLKVIYIFAIIGLLTSCKKDNSSKEIVIWMLLGWIAIHLLIEAQPRYRYLGMPYIFMLAGLGIEWAKTSVGRVIMYHKEKSSRIPEEKQDMLKE